MPYTQLHNLACVSARHCTLTFLPDELKNGQKVPQSDYNDRFLIIKQ